MLRSSLANLGGYHRHSALSQTMMHFHRHSVPAMLWYHVNDVIHPRHGLSPVCIRQCLRSWSNDSMVADGYVTRTLCPVLSVARYQYGTDTLTADDGAADTQCYSIGDIRSLKDINVCLIDICTPRIWTITCCLM